MKSNQQSRSGRSETKCKLYLFPTFTFHNLLGFHDLGWCYCWRQSLGWKDKGTILNEDLLGWNFTHIQLLKVLTSAFKSERIRTTHLWTAIWKVKLITPLIFNKASSHRFLRDWKSREQTVIKTGRENKSTWAILNHSLMPILSL